MNIRFVSLIAFVLLTGAAFLLPGCGEKTVEAELVISNEEFAITQIGATSYTVTARGMIRNVGDVDVRNVVIAAGCSSCGTAFRQARWYEPEVEKTDEQKTVIRFLGKGERANYEVTGAAFLSTAGGPPPTELPETLGAYIISYEVAK